MNNLKKLPIGISSFREIITDNYIYVDKTKEIYNLLQTGKVYFLSRPRRFGKSLLISTLEQIFLGNKELFKDLWIYNANYDWKEYTVVTLDFSLLDYSSTENFQGSFIEEIRRIASNYNIELKSQFFKSIIKEFTLELAKINKVVFLIDEYDKPILDTLNNLEKNNPIKEVLKNIFETLKGLSEHIKFIFLTGVTKFAHTSIFSGFNIAQDITLKSKAATILGYTQKELEHYFKDYLDIITQEQNINLDNLLKEIKCWYNGYQFVEIGTKVYNPFSVLNYLEFKHLENYWFATGTPSFLINLIKTKYYQLENISNIQIESKALGTFETDNIPLIPLLFQTGYLTIVNYDTTSKKITLNYPNQEVEESFKQYILEIVSELDEITLGQSLLDLAQALKNKNLDKLCNLLELLFAQVPYTVINTKESTYHALLQNTFSLLCLNSNSEILTNTGRIDLVVILKNYIYIFELKLNSKPDIALKQIEERKYAQKYQCPIYKHKKIILVGLNFNIDKESKNLTITQISKEI